MVSDDGERYRRPLRQLQLLKDNTFSWPWQRVGRFRENGSIPLTRRHLLWPLTVCNNSTWRLGPAVGGENSSGGSIFLFLLGRLDFDFLGYLLSSSANRKDRGNISLFFSSGRRLLTSDSSGRKESGRRDENKSRDERMICRTRRTQEKRRKPMEIHSDREKKKVEETTRRAHTTPRAPSVGEDAAGEP